MTDEIQNCDISKAAHKMRDGALDMKAAVVKHSNNALQRACSETQTTIKTNPFASILVALGVGLAVGAVLNHR